VRLIVELTEEELRARAARGQNLIFAIYWEHDGSYFPADHWTDFGEIVLGWWLEEATRLLSNGATIRLHVMEGPYVLAGPFDRASGRVRFRARELGLAWDVSAVDFVDELISGTRLVIARLAGLGISSALWVPAELRAIHRRLCEQH
jgi:hypothetical protein